jgi:hypothetical protein
MLGSWHESISRHPRTLGLAPVTRTAIAVLLVMHILTSAQGVTAPNLKAAFMYHFAKLTAWPVEVVADGEPSVICVVGDAAVPDAHVRAVKGRRLASHHIACGRSYSAGHNESGTTS